MNKNPEFIIDDRWITASRGSKNTVDHSRPYGFLLEKELMSSGRVEDVAVVFLTNRECPWRCLMCDLWKNTTDYTVPEGSIPGQIEWALGRLPAARHIKLYNSGSFFDIKAVPPSDYPAIASILKDFDTVIAECHPSLAGENVIAFRDMLKPQLQAATGLETADPFALAKLNKKMTVDTYAKTAAFFRQNEIPFRTFILLKPPFQTEDEGVYWAEKSVELAFENGSECCVVIPVRPGNGAMDILMEKGHFFPPSLKSLEKVVEYGISLNRGRVFSDTWDLELFSACGLCTGKRTRRITEMNITQRIPEQVSCICSI
jgi:hypothetical protein